MDTENKSVRVKYMVGYMCVHVCMYVLCVQPCAGQHVKFCGAHFECKSDVKQKAEEGTSGWQTLPA